MKRIFCMFMAFTLLMLSGCVYSMIPPSGTIPKETTPPVITEPAETQPVAETEPATDPATEPSTEPEKTEHSALYIPDLSVEDVIRYFNEVCLDSEFVNSGDPSVVQKWVIPIYYILEGDYTDEDIATLEAFVAWLNTVEGFPGIQQTDDFGLMNLRISFGNQQHMVDLMGNNFYGMDGAVTFWYDYNCIYDATICYRSDINQYTRNSVILEEIYNGLGPIQDTCLRPDSIIYQNYSEPQSLTEIDELILKLLYHPDILPGMNAAQCEEIIRNLYY